MTSRIAAGNVTYNYQQLQSIWNQAGGNAQAAPMAAAIAMAESGGNTAAYNTNGNGSVDRGLWQINSVHGTQSSFDVMTNARAAVDISNKGSNWRPWCTAYSDGACGSKGGNYLGPGAPYQKFYNGNAAPDPGAPINATNAKANLPSASQATTTSSVSSMLGGVIFGGLIDQVMFGILNPMIQITAGVLGVAAGGLLMLGGVWLMVRETAPGQAVSSGARRATGIGMAMAFPEAGAEVYEKAARGGGTQRTVVSRRKARLPWQPNVTTTSTRFVAPPGWRPPQYPNAPYPGGPQPPRPPGPRPHGRPTPRPIPARTRELIAGQAGDYVNRNRGRR